VLLTFQGDCCENGGNFLALDKTDTKEKETVYQKVEKHAFVYVFSGYMVAGQLQMDALGWQVGHDSCCFKPWLASLVRSIIRVG